MYSSEQKHDETKRKYSVSDFNVTCFEAFVYVSIHTIYVR